MINLLEKFDPRTALGILAQTALLMSGMRIAEKDQLTIDDKLSSSLIYEARQRLGLEQNDDSDEAVSKISDLFDQESDRIVSDMTDTSSAIERMSNTGNLPSDLYDIVVDNTIKDIHGKAFELERELISKTVKEPYSEQHYGPPSSENRPALISIFTRRFRTTWPLRDFDLLVVGQRDGLTLNVHQSWRLYPSKVNLSGLPTLVEWLRKFSDVYADEIEINGKTGHFFLFEEGPIPNTLNWKPGLGKQTVTISRFSQRDPLTGQESSAFVVAINTNKYKQTLKEFEVRRENVFDLVDRVVEKPLEI